jgi:hypothetical protein
MGRRGSKGPQARKPVKVAGPKTKRTAASDLESVRRAGGLLGPMDDVLPKVLAPSPRGAQGPGDPKAWRRADDAPGGDSDGNALGRTGGGTGVGGDGKYVDVGPLVTRGPGGGGDGRGFPKGEPKLGDHAVSGPVVQPGEPKVDGGGLTRDIIQRVIRSHLHEIRYCYERELAQDQTLGGKVVVTLRISPAGQVEAVGKKLSNMNNEALVTCVLERVARWQFPEPRQGVPVLVSYPFLFKSAGEE